MNRLSIAMKLGFGFRLLMVLMVTLGLLSLNQFGKVNDQSKVFIRNWMASLDSTTASTQQRQPTLEGTAKAV